MIILDQPYVSPELAAYAASRQEAVLDNYMARACATGLKAQGGPALNIVSEDRFAALLHEGQDSEDAAPPRLYTCSENSLAWVTEHCAPPLASAS